MRGAVLYGPRDIRFEDREVPKIVEPTDAVIGVAVTCVCGSTARERILISSDWGEVTADLVDNDQVAGPGGRAAGKRSGPSSARAGDRPGQAAAARNRRSGTPRIASPAADTANR